MQGLNKCAPRIAILGGVETAPTTPTPRRRLKWLKHGLLGLALLAVVGFVGVECFRQYLIETERSGLQQAVDSAGASLLNGRTPREFYIQRAKGDNGWSHYETAVGLVRPDGVGEGVYLLKLGASEYEVSPSGLLRWYSDSRPSDSDDPNSEPAVKAPPPSVEDMNAWLKATDAIAEQMRQASRHEFIARRFDAQAGSGSVAVAVLPSFDLVRVAAARAELLFMLGKPDLAEAELLCAANMAMRLSFPCSLIELMVQMAQRQIVFDAAVEFARKGILSLSTLDALAEIKPHPGSNFLSAIEGETAWLVWLSSEPGGYLEPDQWFGWLRGETKNTMGGEGLNDATWASGITFRRQMRLAISNSLENLDWLLTGGGDWRKAPQTPVSMFTIEIAPRYLASQLEDCKLARLRLVLALRAMEKRSGPLSEHRQEAEEVAKRFLPVGLAWEGKDAMLSLPYYLFERKAAAHNALSGLKGANEGTWLERVARAPEDGSRENFDETYPPLRLAPVKK